MGVGSMRDMLSERPDPKPTRHDLFIRFIDSYEEFYDCESLTIIEHEILATKGDILYRFQKRNIKYFASRIIKQ